jgi:cell division protein ZapA
MPNVTITIGGRDFDVACQEGEEHFLQSAAKLLDNEASVLVSQIGRMPEPRMLLMAGLMLADKTLGMEEQLRASEKRLNSLRAEVQALQSQKSPEPERIEVPTVPREVEETLRALATRAEALARKVGEKAGT